MAGVDKALAMLRNLPRVSIGNLRPLVYKPQRKNRRGQHGGRKRGYGDGGQGARGTLPRLGFEGGNTPLYLRIPKEPYYNGQHTRRQYPPLSLLQLQRMIDMGVLSEDAPIDLTALCNTRLYGVNTFKRQYGVNLTEEGADIFQAKINVEVQWTDELTIAAIERNGGVITTRFYDLESLHAVINPEKFFRGANPIPRCKLPPEDAIEYYTNPMNRGYLADPEKVAEARAELAQKYGYVLPNLTADPKKDVLMRSKDPRQLFYGLEPGWIVNLNERIILKPTDEALKEYYRS